jgi:hypothetical protein
MVAANSCDSASTGNNAMEAQVANNAWQRAHVIQVLDAGAWLAFCGTESQPRSADCWQWVTNFLEDSTESTKI